MLPFYTQISLYFFVTKTHKLHVFLYNSKCQEPMMADV